MVKMKKDEEELSDILIQDKTQPQTEAQLTSIVKVYAPTVRNF